MENNGDDKSLIKKVIIGLFGFEKNKDDEMNRDYESLNDSDEYYLIFHRHFCLRNVYR